MAPPPGTLRVGRYFAVLLVLFAALYSLVAFGSKHTPKLGIDLVGGKRVIFTAKAPHGKTPSSSSMDQARQIIAERINGNGVTGSTVQVQGGNQLVVSIPGGTDTDVAKLGQAAVMNFRPVIAPAVQVTCLQPGTKPSTSPSSSGKSTSPSTSPTSPAAGKFASNAPNDARHRPLAAPASSTTPAKATSGAKTGATATPTPTPTPTGSGTASTSTPAQQRCLTNPIAAITKADKTLKMPTTEDEYAKLSSTQQQEISAALANFDCSAGQSEPDKVNSYFVACGDGTNVGAPKGTKIAYLLGSVIVRGQQIDTASAQAPNTSGTGGSSEWSVSLDLKGSGQDAWASWTNKHNSSGSTSGLPTSCGASTGTPCSDFVAFTLDGEVISSPITTTTINHTATSITGSFSQSSANALANQLKFGALPLSFRADSNEDVSATLGTAQLKAAFLAGGIGLLLVVIYSLLYYRGLGLVTIASLIVSGGLTYAMLVILGTQMGFTLDLSGIAGFIVALGITADSFVVFFERIKDEVHEGRSLRVAIPRAWVRARRTILSADTVSFLAAAILYYFASADVQGFAFTLGLSTILDLVVVFLFTHPLISVLSRSRAFGSPRFTGLDSVRVGGLVDDTMPAPRAKRSTRRAAGAAASGSTRGKATGRGGTSTAVAERDDEPALDVTSSEEIEESVDETVPPDADTTVPDEGRDEPERSRRRTAPEPGTAAERAAARRARMRGKSTGSDGEGRS